MRKRSELRIDSLKKKYQHLKKHISFFLKKVPLAQVPVLHTKALGADAFMMISVPIAHIHRHLSALQLCMPLSSGYKESTRWLQWP